MFSYKSLASGAFIADYQDHGHNIIYNINSLNCTKTYWNVEQFETKQDSTLRQARSWSLMSSIVSELLSSADSQNKNIPKTVNSLAPDQARCLVGLDLVFIDFCCN